MAINYRLSCSRKPSAEGETQINVLILSNSQPYHTINIPKLKNNCEIDNIIRDDNWTQVRWVPVMDRIKPNFHCLGLSSGNYPQI